ncbi:MAG: hypothetical protein HP494_14025 [Nitrospira sp.]|nr:hypothetical protein [Nitrospira sp.]
MDVIATHTHADFDGDASIVATRKLYPDAKLIIPSGARKTLRNYFSVQDLAISNLNDVDLSHVTRLIWVDPQEPDPSRRQHYQNGFATNIARCCAEACQEADHAPG